MRAPTVVLSCLVIGAVLTGCSSSRPSPTPTPTAADARSEVDWSEYPSATKRIIDEAEGTRDCGALQDMFDVADNAGFLDQMKYIDEALRLADCY